MYRIIANTKDMPEEEWLALRRKGIGGSDAGAVCGVDPYASAMTVYRDKVGTADSREENEAMRQGHDLEDYVARRFMEASGLKVRRSHAMYQSVENQFMLADVDRLVTGEDAGLECKTAGAWGARRWKDGDIPLHYIMQCMHYMAVTGRRSWYIAAVILGREFVYRKILWDDDIIGRMVAIERDFWERHVIPQAMPQPDGSEACDEVLRQYFGTAAEGSVELSGFDERLERRAQIVEQVKALQQEQKQIEQEVKLFMKENESGMCGKFRVTWGNVSTTRLDVARLKSERPDIYAGYAKTTSARRFEVKSA